MARFNVIGSFTRGPGTSKAPTIDFNLIDVKEIWMKKIKNYKKIDFRILLYFEQFEVEGNPAGNLCIIDLEFLSVLQFQDTFDYGKCL